MKKYIISILIVSTFLISTPFISNTALASELSTRDFINLLVIIGVITPDKVPAVNIFLASLGQAPLNIITATTTPSSATTTTTIPVVVIRSSGGGGGGGGGSSRNYNVFYNGNGNTGGSVPTDSTKYKRNTVVTVLENTNSLIKTGYSFYSWNTQADGLGSNYFSSSSFSISSDVTLYAKWVATYSVTYDGNDNTGGTTPTDSSLYSSDALVSIADVGDLVKDGYIFDGWDTAPNRSGYDYTASSTATIFVYESNVTLYAQWREMPRLTIKSSAMNPDDQTIKVEENQTSDEYVAFVFKLDGDNDSDITVDSLSVDFQINNAGDGANSVEDVVDEVIITIGGVSYNADLATDSVETGTGTAVYTVNFDDTEFIIQSGDTQEVRVELTFNEQQGNYANDTTVLISVSPENIEARTSDGNVTIDGGTKSGATLTLSTNVAEVTDISWLVPSNGTYIDFFFTVEASYDDFNVLIADVSSSTAGTAIVLDSILSRVSGADVTTVDGGFMVNEGDSTTFRVRYNLSGDNGAWSEITITSVAGQEVVESSQVSPTATINNEV